MTSMGYQVQSRYLETGSILFQKFLNKKIFQYSENFWATKTIIALYKLLGRLFLFMQLLALEQLHFLCVF